jgi:hypothetical protein
MSDIDLPRSPDRKSCPQPHLKQKQRMKYKQETWTREVEVQAREYCMSLIVAVLRYIEHIIKKAQVHRLHRVYTVVREHHGHEKI